MLYLDYSRESGQWSPNIYGGNENLEAIDLLKEVNATVYKRNAGALVIAEESTAYTGVTARTDHGGLGFGLKWNMGWMHDSLEYLKRDPIYRKYHHNEITFSMVYAYSENYVLPLSHDEVVYGKKSLVQKMPGDIWKKFAGVRSLLTYQWSHPGKMLAFMGSEFAQWSEWEDEHSLDWGALEDPAHLGVYKMLKELNRVYKTNSALWELDESPEGFAWLNSMDSDNNILCYERKDSKGNSVIVVINFSANVHYDYQIPLPQGGEWKEIFNSDNLNYGGSGVLNSDIVTLDTPMYSHAHSAKITVPPLAGMLIRHIA
jgi:1,4-alpha-glucan branching enzyme